MQNFGYYLRLSLHNIKRAPLPYALTLVILSIGLGIFFSNATLYYWLNRDPLPEKSHTLFFPRINSALDQCQTCLMPRRVLSYLDIQTLSNSGIPSAQAGMYQSDGYARLPNTQNGPTPVTIRVTQRDFFKLFDVPFLHGQTWQDNTARMELILQRNTAIKFFGRDDVIGQQLQLDGELFTIVGVLDNWQMMPRLYDVNNSLAASEVEEIYLPWETGYDLSIKSNTTSQTSDDLGYETNFAVNGRIGQFHHAQFWVQLDTPEQQKAYQQFMDNLVVSEKEAGRHPRPNGNKLHNLLDIADAFNARNKQLDAFAVVSVLFLLVCLFNASHLSLNRYLASQFEFSLRRALGASRGQLQGQLLADVLVNGVLAFILALLFAVMMLLLINHLLPATSALNNWQPSLLLMMLAVALLASYLVTLYPAIRASFSPLNRQLKA